MTDVILDILKPIFEADVTAIDELQVVGRMTDTGKLMGLNSGGIDDRIGNMGYIRYREDFENDIEGSDKKYSSCATTYDIISKLRAVFKFKCDRPAYVKHAIQNAFIQPDLLPAIQSQFNVQGIQKIRTELVTSTSNVTFILEEEYPESDLENIQIPNDIQLFLLDFDLVYETSGTVCFEEPCHEC